MLQFPPLWNYLPAPSKGFQLNPKGPRDGELTSFRNHLAPFGRSMYMNGWFLFKGFSCRKIYHALPWIHHKLGVYILKNSEKKKTANAGGFQTSSGGEPSNSQKPWKSWFFFPRKMEATTNDHKITTFFKIKNVHDICFCWRRELETVRYSFYVFPSKRSFGPSWL